MLWQQFPARRPWQDIWRTEDLPRLSVHLAGVGWHSPPRYHRGLSTLRSIIIFKINNLFQWTGYFGWTGSAYACDNITNYQKCSNIGPFTNLTLNFCTVIIFYAYVIIKMILMRVEQPFRDNDQETFRSISLTMLLLTLVYLAFLLPIATCETCSPGSDLLRTTQERAILANW